MQRGEKTVIEYESMILENVVSSNLLHRLNETFLLRPAHSSRKIDKKYEKWGTGTSRKIFFLIRTWKPDCRY